MCIAAGTFYSDENRKRFSPQNYFKTQSEMMQLFADIPEAFKVLTREVRALALDMELEE